MCVKAVTGFVSKLLGTDTRINLPDVSKKEATPTLRKEKAAEVALGTEAIEELRRKKRARAAGTTGTTTGTFLGGISDAAENLL